MTSGKTIGRVVSCLLGFALAGCATLGSGTNEPNAVLEPIVDPPEKANAPLLLVAMPNSRDFLDARKGLVSEVQKNFNIATFVVTGDTKPEELAAIIEQKKPVCSVLMNNMTVNLYRQYENSPAGAKAPPAVVVMAAFVDEIKSKLKRATGIAYEVPGVTAFINLRGVVTSPVNKVGVVHRPPFKGFVDKQRELALKEHVEVISQEVPIDVSVDGLKDALTKLAQVSKVDAVWMLNDNGLLRDPDFLDQTWRSALANTKIPLIAGLSNLVDPDAPLAAIAVVPDHEALGFQTANLIFDLQDNDWAVEEHKVELPLSVKTIVDVRSVRATFGLQAEALRHIDKALE